MWSDHYAGDERLGYRVLMENEGDGAQVCLTAEVAVQNGEIVNQFSSDIQRLPANMHSAQDAQRFNNAILAAINYDGLVFTAPDCCSPDKPIVGEEEAERDQWVRVPEEQHRRQLADRATPASSPAPVDPATPSPDITYTV